MPTALILIGCASGYVASFSKPRITRGSASRRVISKKRSRCSESSETLKRLTPAATRSAASRSSRKPLVVIERSSTWGRSIAARRGKSRRTSGSPPVSRRSRTPIRASSAPSRSSSPNRGTPARRSHGSPSAGMQYWQRKLHRSVTETRTSRMGRPWPSRSGSISVRLSRVITGLHAVVFTSEPARVRPLLGEVLGFDSVDPGGGWLIFALPPAELAAHPTDERAHHELYLMCDDIHATVADLKRKGVAFTNEIVEERWGLTTAFEIPGGGQIALY